MARWESGTAERLQQAALDLFTRQGFEATTATEIAQAVGVTERTFFRHFADKREVLFQGQDAFNEAFLDGVDRARRDAAPLEVVAAAVRGGAALFADERRSFARARQAVIDADAGLQERERHKLAGLADSLATALRGRGVDDPAATLAAQSGVTVFGVAFARWIRPGEQASLTEIAASVFDELTGLFDTGSTSGRVRAGSG